MWRSRPLPKFMVGANAINGRQPRFTTVNVQNLPILRDLVALFTILFRISVSKLMSDGYNEGECVPNIRRGWDAESRLSN